MRACLRLTIVALLAMAATLAAQVPSFPTFVETVAGHSAEDLGLTFVEPRSDKSSAFVVGGRNRTDLIASLTSLNGVAIPELEKQMRPGAAGKEGSGAGFLGKSESLLDVLTHDNAVVVDELKMSHQDLARPLLLLGYYAKKHAYRDEKEVSYGNLSLKVSAVQYRGYQYSPFMDGTKTNTEVTVVNVDTGYRLKYSLLVPQMIERYGFYEGQDTKYRVEPKAILELLRPRTAESVKP